VPDYQKWGQVGGNSRDHTYRQVPQDMLVPLPPYDPAHRDATKNVYMVDSLGTYATGEGEGSHPGMDIAVPIGTPVLAVANGFVTKVGNDVGGYGIYVITRHPNVPDPDHPGKTTTLHSIYAHLSAALVAEGETVQKGQQIAESGMTGNASGPHLHWQMDQDSAPWHPYWPFTSAEAKQAGMNFNQAVDAGLHRERGLQYTVHPMLYVQAYGNATTVVQATTTPEKRPAPRKVLTIGERREQRLAKLAASKAVTVALLSPEEQQQAATASANSSSVEAASSISSVASVPVAAALIPIAAVRFQNDRSFGADREWKTVTITLLDDHGDPIVNPKIDRPLALRTAYGQAEFKPATLSAKDFQNGTARFQVLPHGKTTVVIRIEPGGWMSEQPMQFVSQN
jgi:hypothetical protein